MSEEIKAKTEEKKPEQKINVQEKINLIDQLITVKNIAIFFKALMILIGLILIFKIIIKM